MDKTIAKFKKLQKRILGHVRYEIRRQKEKYSYPKKPKNYEHWVEIYTKSGLLARTILSRSTEHEVNEFINNKTNELLEYEKEMMCAE